MVKVFYIINGTQSYPIFLQGELTKHNPVREVLGSSYNVPFTNVSGFPVDDLPVSLFILRNRKNSTLIRRIHLILSRYVQTSQSIPSIKDFQKLAARCRSSNFQRRRHVLFSKEE